MYYINTACSVISDFQTCSKKEQTAWRKAAIFAMSMSNFEIAKIDNFLSNKCFYKATKKLCCYCVMLLKRYFIIMCYSVSSIQILLTLLSDIIVTY